MGTLKGGIPLRMVRDVCDDDGDDYVDLRVPNPTRTQHVALTLPEKIPELMNLKSLCISLLAVQKRTKNGEA